LGGGERARVLFQAIDAEQFGDDRLLDIRFRLAPAPA
jgi:hypothetical protein